ncbi:type III-B CRISPR-associated protein Cas10/Cmr2 [Thermoanaerobacterium thermosaccharolyticum]|uniref:type III-B CRISPR-associated protein Cas10/Cmr2 n=1 Tax=Thermoanaerobacterium thermosaccharolyticum TaxID=1517 RepID=UPI0017829341|nr:type III-B CRISPR-associated protein Cas10/Cmr2 [Thermoanaerobacterium thermosaccharolyticum]MBE0069284.1 type III-B CRISPR-associated protein Cas10/Cmr2 [Thermoanaerobacterium thermosaccharolyticum]MBE0229070.1 type III-B CRISPR-associated protein Cas10/Cmr2 [Thermoanaerobacterium thermosaccharolyticum]
MSMREKLFERKLKAFFHDSPDKPFILLTGENHEMRAHEICEKLGIVYDDSKGSDIVASSMERYYLPKNASRNKELQVVFQNEPEFVHPLSGKKYSGFLNIRKDVFKKAVDDAIRELSQKNFNNNFEKFVYIWRYLNEYLKKYTPIEYRKYWDIVPADTRFPNHTIFEHLKVTSSMNADLYNKINLNNMTLFIFTIGPVQEYIAQARKTQDLYWGSYILSYLTWVAIEKVIEVYGPDSIIFPDLIEQPLCDFWIEKLFDDEKTDVEDLKTPSIPNRFFAILPTKDIQEIRSLNLEKVVRDEFIKIGDYVINSLLICDDIQKEIFRNQLKDFLDVYWVALPLENGNADKADWKVQIDMIRNYFADDEIEEIEKLLQFVENNGEYKPNIGNIYGLLYSFMEKMIGARKAIRNFSQYEEEGRKCSICGERNVIVYRCTNDEDRNIKKGRESHKIKILRKQNAIIKKSDDKGIPYKYISQGEGLCGICLAKRASELYFKSIIGDNNVEWNFPSTAEIALLDIINNPDDKLKSMICDYIDMVRSCGINFDYELLYEENLNEAYFEKYNFPSDKLPELKKLLKCIDDRINNLKLNKKKYYAIIKFDGDDMGKWLSGVKAPDMLNMYHSKIQNNLPDDFKQIIKNKRRLMTPDVHSSISKALKNYSIKYVRKIVEESGAGKVIYSGGDDVLAIVNLNSLIDVMIRLRAAFSGHLNVENGIKPDFTIDTGFIDYKDRIDILMGYKVTASMGVAIAHYKEDLRNVVESVNQAEECAKMVDGKNAFSIKLILHSGENYIATAKWNYNDISDKEGTIGILKNIHSFFANEKVSTSFVEKLKDSLDKLNLGDLPHGIFDSEVRRNIMRSLNKNLNSNEKEKIVNDLHSLLSLLYKEVDYDNFIGLLFILTFINRGGEK